MIQVDINESVSATIDADDPHIMGKVTYRAVRGSRSAIDALKDLLKRSPGLYFANINPDYTTAADLDAALKSQGIYAEFDVPIRPYKFQRGETP